MTGPGNIGDSYLLAILLYPQSGSLYFQSNQQPLSWRIAKISSHFSVIIIKNQIKQSSRMS